MGKLVFGVGRYVEGKFVASVDGKRTKEYQLWTNMLQRCYSKKYHVRYPTYTGCEVSKNFKNFQWFAEWCQTQIGFGLKGYHLDKDYLGSGKSYSEDTCVFVPWELNMFLLDCRASRGNCVVGVHLSKETLKYEAAVRSNNSKKFLGRFENELSAFTAYKKSKEAYALELASKYSSYVDPRVISNLQNFKVSCSKYVKKEE